MTVYIGPKDRQLSSPIVHFDLNEPMGGPFRQNKRLPKLDSLKDLKCLKIDGLENKRPFILVGAS